MSLEVLVSVISIATFLGGIVAWWSAKVEKSYAAKRDFEHLKRNYQQLAENQKSILGVLDDRFDKLDRNTAGIEQKINVLMIRVLPEQSTGWHRKQDVDKGQG